MKNAEYIKSCTEYGMAKEILKIAKDICGCCNESVCCGVNDCEWFTEKYGAPSLTEWLHEERKGM